MATISEVIMLLLKRISHAIILIVGSMFILPAHGALNLGDIVVLGVNSDAPTDQVTIMLLADIASGETIKITDRGWDSDSIAFYSNTISEGTITWTTTSSLTAGNVYQIAITAGSPATLATLPGTLSISGWVSSVMASGGDQWLIYQGSDVSPTFIYGFSNPSTNNAGGTVAGNWVSAGTAVTSTTSHLPSGLTNNTNAIALSTGTYHSDNMYYSGSLVATDKTTWLARITTLSNWTGNESTTYDISPGGAIFAAQETVTGLNSVPTTANFNGDSFTYTEGGGTQVLDQSTQATVTDGDSADFNGGNLTLTITSGEDAAEDILSIDTSGVISLAGTFAGNNISITGPGVIGTLGNNIAAGNDFIINLNASATPALVQTLVRALTYQNSDTDNPTTGPRNVRLSISDGDGGTSSNADITVSVVGSNDSPSINNLAGDNLNYSEGNGQQNIDTSANATVSDVDSTNFDTGSLTATILTNQDASEDILGFDNNVTTTGLASASITISATNIGTLTNAISEGNDLVITFNSNATPALVQSLLRAISYENSDTLAPTESTRTIRLILTDGDGGSSGNIDTTVVVSAINDLPVGTNNNLNPNESAVLTLTTSDFGYSDPEGDSLSYITITAAPVNGILWIDTDGSGTVNNAESALASNATISKANLDANLLKYLANGSTSSGFTFNVNDGIGDALANNTMTLTVNPRPTVAINQASGQADPTNNAAIIFDVLFNESVTGFDASDVSLNLDSGMAASVTNISGSGTTYQVTATITAGDGNISATVLAGGATDAGGATNKISGSTDNQITVDNTGPQIVSASLNTGNLKAGDTITAVLNFDETVVLSGSNSTATLDIGGTQRIATYLSGHNSSALSFSYVITTGEEDTDGVRLVSLQTNSDTAQDSLGNSATLSFTPITEANLLVDAIAPTGYDFSIDQSIIGSNATLLSFTITGGTDGDTYSYTLSDGITTLNGNGTLTGASHNVSAIDVSSLNETTLTLSLTLTDSFGNIGSAANDTVIKLYNAAPVMNQGTSVSITMSEDSAPTPFSLTLNATDIDTLSWSIGSNAANGSASVSGSNTSASINYTPTAEYFGSDSFIVAVTDGEFTTTTTVNVTITSVNDLPTITGTPATSVKVGNLYSFAPTTTDTDANPSLSCTITNKPAWASFNSTTGVLTGTPTADDVGTNSNIIISVTDGTDTVSLTSFNISVIAINSAPVASNASVSVDEDTSLSITPSVQDAEGDTLSYSITQPPTNGQLSQSGSIWLYQPDSDYSGNDSFSFTASDGELASQTAIVSISIKSINDKPVAVTDMLSMPSTQSNVYLLDLIANDIDIDGDELSIIKVGSNIGKAKIVNNRVEYTAEAGVQSQIKITYVISDPSKETAKAEAIVTIDNSANPLLPTLTLPADIEINAQQLFTKVDLGFATALDYLGEPAHVTRLTQGNHFSSGTHQIFWQATDSEGNKVTDSQILVIHPYLTFAENEQSAEDSNYQVRLSLSGQAPSYPLTIPYTVSGTSDTSDHSAIDAEIVIDKGTRAVIELTIYGDNETEVDETLVLTFAANTLGNKVYSLLITEGNIAPQISTEVQQAGQKRHIIVTNSDLVTISTDVFDANSQDSHSYQWMPVSSAVVNTSNQDSVFEFSPAGLIAGLYPITLTVTDDAATALSSQQTIYLELVTALPVLTDADSDGDLIPDSYEGIGDSDNDGIPDYQDGVLPCHIMPEQVPMQQQFLAQGQSDICLRKGLQSSDNSSGGLLLTDEEVEIKLGSDTNVENIGGVFDFILFGLPQVGGTYDIAIPQQLPLPENPIYRKFIQGNWQNFIQDNNNQLASSLGEAGHCPAPNDPSWVTGLTQGHWCVKLSIQDGGPNDNDGIANGSIVDPGGVGVARSSNILPVANPDNITMQANTAELIDVLANDIDANGDQLTILGASTNIGTVAIENNQLRYSTETDHYGELIVNYNIDDNNGGTAHTTVVVNVIANSAPLAIDDTLNTDDQQVVEIDVLANDSDKESSIDLISATAEVGSVEITANQMLRYTPVEGFEGLDTIDYTITDEHGAQSQAQVMIMVTAAKEITIQNKASSGGSIGGLILILGAFVFIARSRLGLLLLSLIGFNSVASDWSIETELGQSWADYSSQQSIPSGELISYDKSDFSWSLGVGYLIAPRWQLSARYIDMGQSSAQIQATTTLPTELQYNTPVLAKGAGVDIAYSFWQSERFSASASLGAIYWQQELSSEILDSPSSKISSDSDHLDAYFGLNIKYQLSANWHTGIKATRYDLEANSVDNLYLMLGYRF
ncbi:tandem-95 repeat protein [Shewanella psychropiezotolerans]|uniref:Tandem-95 repeat protein n=1 Tax=Shewanella psychropiezotolerans TaxID=2593655 RepID=A0ABX5X7S0_9GAMM|nr:tandem-95 repeat protein [Shewanella psychropiezotolerans]QDO86467.1 tandem-95 repeat protein [Shewanella psychropiezotolerans]